MEEVMATAREATPGKMDKAALKAQVAKMMARAYMRLHAVNSGTCSGTSTSTTSSTVSVPGTGSWSGVGAQVEDARAALRAYWRISTRRLVDDVLSSVELVLLQRGSEVIEQRLLEETQSWVIASSINNNYTSNSTSSTTSFSTVGVAELLSEEPTTRVKRAALRTKKQK
jgi:hypothetical protein